MLQSALDHYARQQRFTAAALIASRRKGMSSFELAQIVAAIQLLAARDSLESIDPMLDEQDIEAPPVGLIQPSSFAGTASDGRPLETLFEQATSAESLGLMVVTQIQDAARAAAATSIAARPSVGYVRMLNPPSCSRCAVLAGKFYRFNDGFLRHPRCFPAGTVVSGPTSEAATRRWYEGELVVLSTASGQELSLTGNHPILTGRGWVAANLVQEGDEVVRSTLPQGATPLVIPDHHEMPSLIEDVWSAFSVGGLQSMPTSPEDFHGDGQRGEVDVVYPDRPLRAGVDATLREQFRQQELTRRIMQGAGLDLQRSSGLLDLGHSSHSGGPVGGSGLTLPFGWAEVGVASRPSLAHVTPSHPGVLEHAADGAAGYPMLSTQRVLARSGHIGGDDGFTVDLNAGSGWDAPTLADPMEQSRGYTAVGLDLLHRLTGQVELDRVILSRSVDFRGHVFSLTSSEGWHTANSLIVSNCDCRHVPSRENVAGDLTTDPNAYFDSLTQADQDKYFTKAGAEAICQGADVSQVVNTRRRTAGMQFAQESPIKVDARGNMFTTEGTTRRGIAAQQQSGLRQNGPQQMRLMPETILRRAKDREDAQRLLRLHGYILDAPAAARGRSILAEARRSDRQAAAVARRAELRAAREARLAGAGGGSGGGGPRRPVRSGDMGDGDNLDEVSSFLMAEARRIEPTATPLVELAAGDTGGTLHRFESRFKTEASIREKLERFRKGSSPHFRVAKFNDALRYTVVYDEDTYWPAVQQITGALARNNFAVPLDPTPWRKTYSGVNVTVRHPDGITFEVQLHTEASLRAAEDTHTLYEEQRKLRPGTARWNEIRDELIELNKAVPRPPGMPEVL